MILDTVSAKVLYIVPNYNYLLSLNLSPILANESLSSSLLNVLNHPSVNLRAAD